MKIIFYLLSSVLLIKELVWILNPKEQIEKSKKNELLNKQIKGLKYSDFNEEQKSYVLGLLISFTFVLGWLFVGLFTFQWQLFLAFLLFQFIVIAPISSLLKYSFAYMILHWLNSIVGFLFVIFVIINSYHLKIVIDLIKYFS